MKVYVVILPYDGEVYGVYQTLKLAEEALMDDPRYEFCRIEEFDIQW
jgi:hypothetical protein